jgi:GxxExxY protein
MITPKIINTNFNYTAKEEREERMEGEKTITLSGEHAHINTITGKVIQCAIEVHRVLGPGLLESVYEKCMAYELVKAGLTVEIQKELPLRYKEVQLDCGFRLDIVVEGAVVIEIKSVEKVLPIHEAQILTYMKLAGIKTGLLINFNERLLKDGLKRFVL